MDLIGEGNDPSNSSSGPTYVGFICAGVAVLFFGSNFVPIKKFETGDGMFFQWIVCSSIWFMGLCVNAMRHFPVFYPLAMLGGFLWATGNIMVVPIVKTIGLSQGILVWGSCNLLAGWASGRFGWFGLKPEKPHDLPLSYAGLGMCVISAFIFLFIKSNVQSETRERQESHGILDADDDDEPLLNSPGTTSVNIKATVSVQGDETFIDRLSPVRKRILGTAMAVVSGVLYGVNFAPVIYIQDNYDNASQNGLDYVFSHFCGIYVTSTVFLLIYCGWMRNRPRIYSQVILPGFISGAMWAIADASWFVANKILSEPISFPIITTGPGIIASLWGVLVFNEISGYKNFAILGVAILFTVAGGVMTGLSKN